MATTSTPEKGIETARTEWARNWPTGIASMIGMGVGASIFPTISSLFIEPLQETFGWTRGQISLAHYASLLSAVAAPFAGRLIDRVGARPLIVGGFVLIGLTYSGLALMQGYIWMLYALFAIMHIVAVGTSGLGFSRVLAAAFVRSRGFSLAVGRSGLAISSALLPTLLFLAIDTFGWRGGYALMALLALGVALPACYFGIERRLELKGAQPSEQPRQPWWLLLKNRRVLTLAIAAALSYTPLIAVTTQLQPLLVGSGIEAATAASMLGLLGIASFVGLIVTGLLIDRLWAPMIAAIFMAAAAVGAVMMLQINGDWRIAALGVILLGFAYGAEVDISAYLIARYCGMGQFASIYGIMVLMISISTATGSSMIGILYDYTRSYDLALIFGAAMLVTAACSYLSLGRYPRFRTY